MAYSETSVLIGGLAHVPIIILLLFFLNNITKKLSDTEVSPKSEKKKETKNSVFLESKSTSTADSITEKRLSNEIDLQRDQTGLGQDKIEFIKQEEEPKKIDGFTQQKKDDKSEQQLEMEERLQKEVERLEAEAELKKLSVQSKGKGYSKSNYRKTSENHKKSRSFNLWQIAAVAVLTVGGTSIFLSNNYQNPEVNNKEDVSISLNSKKQLVSK